MNMANPMPHEGQIIRGRSMVAVGIALEDLTPDQLFAFLEVHLSKRDDISPMKLIHLSENIKALADRKVGGSQ
jgi:hypothetical protein